VLCGPTGGSSMTQAQFTELYSVFRFLPILGALVLLGEWLAWLALLPPPFRWTVRYVHRALGRATQPLPRTRLDSPDMVLVPGRTGEWLFRPPQGLFRVSTPFFLFGHVRQTEERLEVVGR
jgi:hypothetical protein